MSAPTDSGETVNRILWLTGCKSARPDRLAQRWPKHWLEDPRGVGKQRVILLRNNGRLKANPTIISVLIRHGCGKPNIGLQLSAR